MLGSTSPGYDPLMQGWTMAIESEEQPQVSSASNASPAVNVKAIVAAFGDPFSPSESAPAEENEAMVKKSKDKKSKVKGKKSKDKEKHKDKKKKHKAKDASRSQSSLLSPTVGEKRWQGLDIGDTTLQPSDIAQYMRQRSCRVSFDVGDALVPPSHALCAEDDQREVWSDDDALVDPSRRVSTNVQHEHGLNRDSSRNQALGSANRSLPLGKHGLQRRAGEKASWFSSYDYDTSLRQDLQSENQDEVSLELLVGYMMSMGADQATAEQFAFRFAAEQEESGSFGQSNRLVRPSYVTTSKATKTNKSEHYNIWIGDELPDTSSDSPLSTSQSSFNASPLDSQVVQATAVKESEADWPIVYAESTPIGIKQLLSQRPIRRLLCVAVLFFVAGIVGLILYLTVFKKPVTAQLLTNTPTMSPSQSPTFLSDDVVNAAVLLSRPGAFDDPSSPQFRAVGWMSSFDTMDTSGFGTAFAQRYALVVIYFSLEGEGWTNQEKWLDPTLHECKWSSGIFCEYDVSEQQVVTGFDATRNNLQGSIPDEIGLLVSSESFRIPKNTVGGTLPSTIGSMSSLSVIDLSDNVIEGSIPSTIGGAKNLIQLDFSNNKLNSTIPNELYSLKLLRTLVVKSNLLSGPLNETIDGLQSLVTLDVRNNMLSGPLPLSFDAFPSLAVLWLDYNQFSGLLPNITNAFITKQVLSLSNNKFYGNAQLSPDFNFSKLVGEENRVQHIDISYNQLSGPISATFFFLPKLRVFDLSGNDFTGTFPSNVGWLEIEHLAASNNALTGTVPVGYPTLSKCFVALGRYGFI